MPRFGCRGHRPPEVLRRAYGNRVRRILDAILYLLPSPPPFPNSCPYGRCLRCVPASQRKSWLVRHGDPDDYRQLLTLGFAAFRKTAPALPADFDPRPLHDQRQVVQIYMKGPQRISSNRSRYAPVDASSDLDNLSDSAWHLLLMRIGDVIMLHLLKFSSIFLPLLNNKYYEVNGSSRSDFYPHHMKAKETELHMQTFSSKNAIIQGKKNIGVDNVKCMRDSRDYIPGDSPNARKRTRPSSWQRRRKRRKTSSYTSDANLVHCERKLRSPDNNVQCSELLTCSGKKGPHEDYVKEIKTVRKVNEAATTAR